MSRVILFLLILSFIVYGQSFKDTEAYQRGRQMGEQGRGRWGGKDNLKGKLQDPTSKGGDLVDIYGNRHRLEKGAICQIADESTQRVVLEVTLSGTNNVTVRWSSDGNSLDRSYSYSGRFLCLDPPSFCSGLTPFTSSTNCTVLNISGGGISTSARNTPPGGCYDTSQSMVVDTVSLARSFSSLLFNDYRLRGIKLEFYKIDETSNQNFSTARVYAVQFKDCYGNPEVNRMSEYQKNPYKAREDALAFYLLCNPDDPDMNKAVACKTLRAMDQVGGVDKSNTGLKSCSVYRSVTSWSTQRSDGRVCQPGAKVYFDGYSERNPWCVAGSESVDFLNLRVSFWLECDFTGTGYILKGWAYWEGAPCGSVSSFPPLPQIDQPINVFSISNNLYVGNLSVNRRVGGPGDTSGSCVSEGSNPWKVFVNVNGSTSNRPVSITVNIPALSSIGCSTFTFNGDLILPGETFRNDCSDYESRCSLVNEWFVDAYNNRYQVVKGGFPVMVYKQCRELVYDNLKKTWNSSDNNLPQTPSENCAGIPRSCKNVGGKQECRIWWRIDREYSCAVTRQLPEVDTTEYSRVLNNTTYDSSSGVLSVAVLDRIVNVNVSGNSSSCPSEDRYCLVKSGKNMDTLKCERNGDSFVCPAEVSKVVEDCKCASELRQGFSYAITALGLIEQALKDKECVK
ncbi:MAG: hypothetical protein QW228_06180 [Candidatus Aenigmatarchaeota archaeon]